MCDFLTGWKGSLVRGSGSGWGPSTESKAGIFAFESSISDVEDGNQSEFEI